MTVTQQQVVIICGGKIFVVEGTHENFNTIEISPYTVHTYIHTYIVYYTYIQGAIALTKCGSHSGLHK